MVISMAFPPDGTRIVSASVDKTIQIWDTSREPAIGSIGHGSPALTKTSSRKTGDPDGTPIFTSDVMLHSDGWLTTSDGQLLFWTHQSSAWALSYLLRVLSVVNQLE
jgi:WD40 repeat protein